MSVKKYFLAIAAIFQNEALYLVEWMEFHRLLGVEHFYLYNNNSSDNYLEVLDPYIKKQWVTLIDWPDGEIPAYRTKQFKWVFETQVPAYEHAINAAIPDVKWLALIDIDEFIVPISTSDIPALLEKYDDFPAIRLAWTVYGTSDVMELPDKTLLIEVLNKTCTDEEDFNTKFFKTIMKPDQYMKFFWPPHIAIYKGNEYDIVVNKFEAKINHYINRTVNHFYRQKIQSKQRAINFTLTPSEIEFHSKIGNAIEDTKREIHRFVPALRKKLGYD